MEKLVALEPEETLRTGETYIGSIQFRTKLFGGQLKEKVADIADEFEAALDADPMVKDKIEFLPHSVTSSLDCSCECIHVARVELTRRHLLLCELPRGW